MVLELNKTFRNIKYNDSDHSYVNYETSQQYTSVTQFLGKLKEPFDSDYWSKKKAKDSKTTQEEILQEWKYLKELGNSRGSYLHGMLEKLNQRDVTTLKASDYMTPLVQQKITEELTSADEMQTLWFSSPIQKSFDDLKSLAFKFINENTQLVPILQEFVVGDDSMGIAGRFDCLYYNEDTQDYEIWDYKTDKKLDFSNKYGKKFKLFNLDECEFEKYSLQLSLYKYIIEKNSGLKLGRSNIVYFKHSLGEYEIIPANDYTELIKEIFTNGHDWTTYIKP